MERGTALKVDTVRIDGRYIFRLLYTQEMNIMHT